jgi:hypothetical protein
MSGVAENLLHFRWKKNAIARFSIGIAGDVLSGSR